MTMAERLTPDDSVIEADVGPVRAILSVADPGTALEQALHRAAADPEVRAIALFLSGSGSEPETAPVAAALAACGKTIVAGLSGAVSGPVLALALACDEILCVAATSFATPEVRQGLVPVFGTTQALARRVGAAAALRLLLTGQPIDAGEAIALGLVDRVIEGDLADAVIARAADLAHRPGSAPNQSGLRDPIAFQAAVTAARAALAHEPLPAPARIVDCVEAALLLPPDQGLAFEAAARSDLEDSEEAAGLAHAARIEARIAHEAPGRDAAAPHGVAIWGTGGLSQALVRRALAAGLRVSLCAPDAPALEAALSAIAQAQEAKVARGQITPEARDSDWARLSPWLDPVAEDAALICPGAEAWVARAARLPVAAVDAGVGAGDQLIALSFPLPGESGLVPGSLCELNVPAARQRQRDGAGALMARMGFLPVETGQGGPVALRLRAALAAAIAQLESEGHSRLQVAAALAARGLIGGRALPRGTKVSAEVAEIVARCEAALANAGARLVQSGAARSPQIVDALALAARLYPRWLGGPMARADRRGLIRLQADLTRWSGAAPQIWSPAALIDRLAAENRRFADLG